VKVISSVQMMPGENSFQREIVDRALPLYYILTDLEQRDELFPIICSTAYYNKRRLSILVETHVGASPTMQFLGSGSACSDPR
jgi:hypothetical protein